MTITGTLKAILALQIFMGVALLLGDVRGSWDGVSLPGFGPRAPELTEPVRPGDQRRRYAPDRAPPGPGEPRPDTSNMPQRLQFTAPEDGRDGILMTGQIAPGDAERFAEWLDGRADPARVWLHSPGGSVPDALTIGRRLREMGTATSMRAGEICLSACPYILAAGAERTADAEAMVGVHQHYFGENSALPAFLAVESIQRGQGDVMAYLDEMGVDPMLMRPALATPPDEIYVLVPEELEDYRLADVPG